MYNLSYIILVFSLSLSLSLYIYIYIYYNLSFMYIYIILYIYIYIEREREILHNLVSLQCFEKCHFYGDTRHYMIGKMPYVTLTMEFLFIQ